SLIGWLRDFGGWSAHSMFTEPVTAEKAASFSRFLGVPLISDETLTPGIDRAEYFSLCRTAGNLFLDPDTGIRLSTCRGLKSVNYVFGEELVEWSRARPRALTLVFDQSFSRGRQIEDIQKKLAFFESHRAHGFAYSSHAPFLLLSADLELARRARERLLQVSGLPARRLVVLDRRLPVV
ncbi:MAG TPA: hypothetical protein VNG71_15365, partial [Pyrinomonadaceae bacterium]|nr:hypothetical protein [Pyrinomonadaceae bacterium]